MAAVRTITARFAGTCGDCHGPIAQGDLIVYGGRGRVVHANGRCLITNAAEGPTTRERKLAKAERLRGWADSREAKSEEAHAKVDAIAGMIPFGQPILVGHHSEGRARRDQERIHNGMRSGIEHARTASNFRSRADGIEAAADRAIYSDDSDAIERLEERIAELEAERDRWKAYNAACRKAKQATAEALALLDGKQRADLASTAKVAGYMLGKFGQAPAYHVTNLTGNITRNRKRLEALRREASN